MPRPICEFCNEKISVFEDYDGYNGGWVHSKCKDEEINKLIFANRDLHEK